MYPVLLYVDSGKINRIAISFSVFELQPTGGKTRFGHFEAFPVAVELRKVGVRGPKVAVPHLLALFLGRSDQRFPRYRILCASGQSLAGLQNSQCQNWFNSSVKVATVHLNTCMHAFLYLLTCPTFGCYAGVYLLLVKNLTSMLVSSVCLFVCKNGETEKTAGWILTKLGQPMDLGPS